MILPDARLSHRLRFARSPAWILLAWLLPALACAQTVQIAKTVNGGQGTYGFTMANLDVGSDSITTGAAGTPTRGVVAGVTNTALPVTLTEQQNPGYQLASADCVDENGIVTGSIGALVGTTITIAPANLLPGVALLCTFVNVLPQPDLSISKQASPTVVASGGTVTYTLTVSNNGGSDATDAVLADTPGTGLSCTAAATCTPSNGATCPASLPASALFGAGVTVPSLPAGSSIVVSVPCTVTASGQ